MCLVSTHTFPKIAVKDIVCYKFLKKAYCDPKQLITPYVGLNVTEEATNLDYLYPEGCENESNLIRYIKEWIKSFNTVSCDYPYRIIERQFIHSFATPEFYRLGSTDKIICYRCIIPRGAVYFKGDNDDYASNCIKFEKLVH